jgi:Ring finger domain
MMPDVCAVCFDDIQSSNSTLLSCSHRFHTNCIDRWLRSNHTCPVCRDTASYSESSGSSGFVSFTDIAPEPASTGGVPTDEATDALTDPEPAPTGGVPTDEAPAPHPEPADAPTDPETAPTGVPTDEAPAPHPEPAGALTDPEPAPTGNVPTDEAPAGALTDPEPAPTGGVPRDEALAGVPTDPPEPAPIDGDPTDPPVPAPPAPSPMASPMGDEPGAGAPTDAPASQTAAAENAGAAAGVTTADSTAAGAPAPSEVTVASVVPKRHRSQRDRLPFRMPSLQPPSLQPADAPAPSEGSVASNASGSPAKRLRSDVRLSEMSAAEIRGIVDVPRFDGFDASAPSGGTIGSDDSAGIQHAPSAGAASGLLGWFGYANDADQALHQVGQGLPPVSAPRTRRPHLVEDDSRPVGELSFDTADEGDDEVSAVTTEMQNVIY